MHELSIAQSVVDAVLDRTGDARIGCVELEIGLLSGVVASALEFCFELVTDGTALEGARLVIVQPAGHGTCRSCGEKMELKDLIVLCVCGSADVEVTGGQELLIRSVEVV